MVLPFPQATNIPTGPLKFSTQPGIGSDKLDITKRIFLSINCLLNIIKRNVS